MSTVSLRLSELRGQTLVDYIPEWQMHSSSLYLCRARLSAVNDPLSRFAPNVLRSRISKKHREYAVSYVRFQLIDILELLSKLPQNVSI